MKNLLDRTIRLKENILQLHRLLGQVKLSLWALKLTRMETEHSQFIQRMPQRFFWKFIMRPTVRKPPTTTGWKKAATTFGAQKSKELKAALCMRSAPGVQTGLLTKTGSAAEALLALWQILTPQETALTRTKFCSIHIQRKSATTSQILLRLVR